MLMKRVKFLVMRNSILKEKMDFLWLKKIEKLKLKMLYYLLKLLLKNYFKN